MSKAKHHFLIAFPGDFPRDGDEREEREMPGKVKAERHC